MSYIEMLESCMNRYLRRMGMLLLGAVLSVYCGSGGVRAAETSLPDLTNLTIEELANIEIISASKTPVKQSQSPAAIFVITSDDIRRSGATSIPEALRLVPGLQVSRINSSKWAVSSRGFNLRYSNKLLVLMDGRALYLPLFSGVFWECQDYVLEDIERIEVIRGPGASLWGSNAVNGVINIITKHSKDTDGALAVAGAGDYEHGFARARLGEKIGKNGYARAYASYFDRDDMVDADNNENGDAWDKFQTGFRSDFTLGGSNELTIQGDYYSGNLNELTTIPALTPPYINSYHSNNTIEGYNVLGRFTLRRDHGSEMAFQVYADSFEKEEGGVAVSNDILDFDFQHVMPRFGRHELIWGLGVRHYTDYIDQDQIGYSFSSLKKDDLLYSTFIQDTMGLSDSFQFIIGSRFEHNEYTGYEFQPNARFLWDVSQAQVLWGAVCRAVRTPSRGDRDIRFTTAVIPPFTEIGGFDNSESPYPVAVVIWGLENVDSEDLTAFELGHRITAGKNFSLDTTAFYYVYDHLNTYSIGDIDYTTLSNDPPYVMVHQEVGNLQEARTWGIELSANWQVLDFMRLQGTYAFIAMHFDINGPANTTFSPYSENDTPRHQASLHAFVDLPWHVECDAILKYVDELADGEVESYTDMDLRLGWKPNRHLEVSVCGQNLFHEKHKEFLGSYVLTQASEVPRSVYGKVTIRY